MVIYTKFQLEEDGWVLVRAYSSKGVKIKQDGTNEIYTEAIDPEFANRTYTETDIPIESEEEEEEFIEE